LNLEHRRRLRLDLDRRVVDAEVRVEHGVERFQQALALAHVVDDHVGAHGLAPRGQRPHVEVVHAADARHPRHGLLDRREVEVGGRALEEDVHGLAQEPPRARHDEDRDRRADERVRVAPAGDEHDGGRKQHAERAHRVAEDLEVRGADVEALGGVPVQEPRGHQVHHEAEGADGEHGTAEHAPRVEQPLVRLVEDGADDDEQHEGVDEGGQDLRPVVAVGLGGRGRARGDPDGEEGEREAAEVGQHVGGVGEEGEAARDERAHHLDEHVAAGEEEGGDAGAARARGRRRAMGVDRPAGGGP
jgi:hypothetical protein